MCRVRTEFRMRNVLRRLGSIGMLERFTQRDSHWVKGAFEGHKGRRWRVPFRPGSRKVHQHLTKEEKSGAAMDLPAYGEIQPVLAGAALATC